MEINDKYKFFGFLGDRINNNNAKIQELLKDENVRKFINLLDENKRLSLAIREGMEECSHVFVMTDVCEEGNVVYHCLKCGLTNEYAVKKPDKILTEYEMQVSNIFKRTFVKGIILGDGVCKLNIAREVYDFIKRNSGPITKDKLQDAFSHGYPKFVEMREKATLGKCKPKKSAAELWYEIEERSVDNAIATLNRITENDERKRK